MKKSAEIRQELSGLINSQTALVDAAKNENRSLTEAETTSFNDLQKQIEIKRGELKIAETHEENLRSLEGSQQVYNPGNTRGADGEENEMKNLKKRYSLHKVMRAVKDGASLDGVEGELSKEFGNRAAAMGLPIAGIAIPMGGETRADGQTVTQDSGGYGGNLVQTDVADPIELLRPKLFLEEAGAVFIPGLTGNLKFPKNNGGVVSTWEGEVAAVSATKNAIGSQTMQPNRLATKVLVSIQNLMQSGVIERMTIDDINMAYAQKLQHTAINGTGSGQPYGILNTSGIGSVAIGTNGGAPTWAAITGLEAEVYNDNADGANMVYLVNTKLVNKLKNTVKVSGYPEYLMGSDGMLNGYKTIRTNLVPSDLDKGTSTGVCSAVIFGDFRQLVIGQFAYADLTIDRVSEVENGYVKFVFNTFNDIMVRHAQAFAACKDFTTT